MSQVLLLPVCTCYAKLLVNDELNSLLTRCSEPTSHTNCTKTFMVSTTCVESDEVCDDHLSQTVVPCPAGRDGFNCTQFKVEWCNNTILPQKGGCYRSEYAHTRMMEYRSEYWFGFSILIETVADVDAVHFQVSWYYATSIAVPYDCRLSTTVYCTWSWCSGGFICTTHVYVCGRVCAHVCACPCRRSPCMLTRTVPLMTPSL